MSRILVVEHPMHESPELTRRLEQDGHTVTTAVDGRQALEIARESDPNLMVLDVDLPKLDGFAVVASLRRLGHAVPTLLLSGRTGEADILRGFQSGGDDFVTRPFSVSVVAARVNALLRRVPALDHLPRLRCGDITIDQSSRTVYRRGRVIYLARREYELLLALITRSGAVVSRQELLRTVWGYRGDAMTRTVDMHIAELRRKLEDTPAQPRSILTVRNIGYRVEGSMG